CKNQAEHRAEQREQNTLGKQLRNDSRAAGTHDRPDRQLLLAPGDTRELNVGDVGARDQQHKSDSSHQQQRELASQIARRVFADGQHAKLPVLVKIGEHFGLTLADRLHLCADGGERDTGLQSAYAPDVPYVAHGAMFRIDDQRHPSFDGHRKVEALGHYANDRETLAINFDVLAENVGIGGKASLPQAVAQDDFLIFARFFFLGKERAAEFRLHADQAEEIGSHVEALNLLRLADAGQIHFVPAKCAKLLKGLRLRFPVEI